MRLPNLVAGEFVARDNRFRASVTVNGALTKARVASSGRMAELLQPGRRLWLASKPSPKRRTPYDLVLVEHEDLLVSVDSHLPNRLWAEHLLREGWEGHPIEDLGAERRLGESRMDFCVRSGDSFTWMEVKSVTLVEDAQALFPDAPTLRGARHMRELAQVAARGQRAAVIFVVQRADALVFSPHVASDPAFAHALWDAAQNGVRVQAYRCRVDLSQVVIEGQVPVHVPHP